MPMAFLWFLVGFIVGAFFGTIIAALLIGSDDDGFK